MNKSTYFYHIFFVIGFVLFVPVGAMKRMNNTQLFGERVNRQPQQMGTHKCNWIIGDEAIKMICEKAFTTKNELYGHVVDHVRQKNDNICRWKDCSGNGKKGDIGEFRSLTTLQNHVKKLHVIKQKALHCLHCKKDFTTQSNFDTHMQMKHPTMQGVEHSTQNMGSVVGNTFIYNLYLSVAEMYQVNQQTQQTGIYRCGWIVGSTICNASFATKETLHSHTDCFHIKQGDKMCHWVGCTGNKKKNDIGGFSSVGALNTHVKHRHTIQPAPLRCFYCGGYFMKTSNLAIHIKAAHAEQSFAFQALVMMGEAAYQEENSNVP